ncbi:MAG: hypothetical protein Fur0021_05920 [Candidatus Promineifilaceae bacterium]
MKRLFIILLVLAVLLAACGGSDTSNPTEGSDAGSEATPEVEIDPDTGLVMNPDLEYAQSGEEFIIDGIVMSLNLTPVTAPEYLILPEGQTLRYRVLGQPLAETYYDDGTLVPVTAFQNGIRVRATVKYDPDILPGGRYVSTNVTIMQDN